MQLIVDRFEEEFVVCENKDKKVINLKRSKLPKDIKVGDVLICINGEYQIDNKKTNDRKSYIEELTKYLWE